MLDTEATIFLNTCAFLLCSWGGMFATYAAWVTWRMWRNSRKGKP